MLVVCIVTQDMSQAINCNFARTAIRVLCQREYSQCGSVKQLSQASMVKVVDEYNKCFSQLRPQMHLSLTTAKKRVRQLLDEFNKKWHPQSQKDTFLSVFSLNSWSNLPLEEKNKHTLQDCSACFEQHLSLTRAFPCNKAFKTKLKSEDPVISFNQQDLSSPSNLGKKALNELNAICEEQFKKSFQDVICETPQSKLIKKPSSQERQSQMRKVVRVTKQTIQQSMDDNSTSTVMKNRISWRKFDKMRKSEALESNAVEGHTPTRKRQMSPSNENAPPTKRTSTGSSSINQTPSRKRSISPSNENTSSKKRKHGSPMDLLATAEEDLLTEARSWKSDETVNWSDLARRYGITKPNGGQSMKEFLRDHDIPAAFGEPQHERSHRRKRKTLPGGIPFPMQRPSIFHKKKIISSEESSVVPTPVSTFTYNKTSNEVVETTSTVYAKKVPLIDIRKKTLQKHEEMGIIRNSGSNSVGMRYLKIWHDHSSIAGHGHLLVLISVIYDSSFYLTTEEAKKKTGKDIDVQSTVEIPEIHILGRSSSSIEDQSLFSACRNECLRELSTPLYLITGARVTDTVRFFHGDGPAQQFEAGNTIGGNYCCVGCGVNSKRIDDLAYAFRCPQLDLQQRQEFLLQGVAWKHISARPLDKLLISDLRKELSMRGVPVKGKKKPILEQDFDDLKLGISNFPALLLDSPETTLQSLNLQQYEISPTEPLHDLKGHLSNIIDEALHISTGDCLEAIKSVKKAVLTREAVRCSDLRKAVILIYLKLKDIQPDGMLTALFHTAVEITNLCYAHDDMRTPRTILCLYNRTFLHAYLCTVLFPNPKSTTHRRMFGRYYHSITAHAATMFRIVSLRSLNTEQHERIFQQAKGITKGTSNNHPQHVVNDILQRLRYEQGTENTIASQESQIKSLSLAVGPMENTVFPYSMVSKISEHYQAHLERIGDYLLLGPGVWWRETPQGIMFLDGANEQEYRDGGPALQHFRSRSCSDIEMYLQQQWEVCCSSGVKLPAACLRYYGQDGSLENISYTDLDGRATHLNQSAADGRATRLNQSAADGRATDLNQSAVDGGATHLNQSAGTVVLLTSTSLLALVTSTSLLPLVVLLTSTSLLALVTSTSLLPLVVLLTSTSLLPLVVLLTSTSLLPLVVLLTSTSLLPLVVLLTSTSLLSMVVLLTSTSLLALVTSTSLLPLVVLLTSTSLLPLVVLLASTSLLLPLVVLLA